MAVADEFDRPRLTAAAVAHRPSAGTGRLQSRSAAPEFAIAFSALWRSRLIVFIAGGLAYAALGTVSNIRQTLDPAGLSLSFGRIGNVIAAPAFRWDSIWYLNIAHSGYTSIQGTRFFPLYPVLIHILGWLIGSGPLAAIVISLGCAFTGLVIIHRLTVLELGRDAADLALKLIAFAPFAFYLSAAYSESLFLALSAGTFLAARQRRWALAGLLGALGALTRVNGFVLLVPVLMMFFYGPDSDAGTPPASRFAPRHRATRDLLWVALIPSATALYGAYLWIAGYGPLAFLRAQTAYLHHVFMVPVRTLWEAVLSAWWQLHTGLGGTAGLLSPHAQSVVGLLAVCAAFVALVGVFRKLPLAYGAYVGVGMLIPLSSPTVGDPLRGFPRYELVLFPLYMWVADWAVRRGARRPLLAGCCAMLTIFTAQFATWHVAGSQIL